ncbi:MAG: hypothetical protein JNM36_05730 [Chitinophagales bacterium]|jgi:lipopolysaccharide biosynthesis glycosyltransferase|nr:hypothetical protein [Chitinophagales bacterium]
MPLEQLNHPTPIVLITNCDNNFAILLGAMVYSLGKNYVGSSSIHLYAISDGIFSINKHKVEQSNVSDKITIQWVEVTESLLQQLNLPDNPNNVLHCRTTYCKLLMPYFLPKEVKKAIYIDVDTIILGDIEHLWNISIQAPNIVAAVQDPIGTAAAEGGIGNYAALGIDADNPYFNAGLIMVDLERWRAADISHRVVNCVNQYTEYADFADQYGLNVILATQWQILDPLWNYYANQNAPATVPHIIHYIMQKPIYHDYACTEHFRQIFYDHLQHTPWRGLKPMGRWQRRINRWLAQWNIVKI